MREALHALRLRVKALLHRRRLDRDLEDELAFHLAMRADSQAEARAPFGNPTSLKERCRDIWTFVSLETFWQDLRYGARMLRKTPAFTIAALLTLALGIGANTAVFSVMNAVLVKSLPYPELDRLVILHERLPRSPLNVSWPDFVDWREQNHVFRQIAAYAPDESILSGYGDPQPVNGTLVSARMFPLLGVEPAMGRLFTDADDRPDATPTVVLGYSFWRNQLHGDSQILGRAISLDKYPFVVIGVLPPNFRFVIDKAAVFYPIGLNSATSRYQDRRDHPGIEALGRLKPGVSLSQAAADLNTIMARLAIAYPQTNKDETATVDPLYRSLLGNIRPMFFQLAAAAALVLLLACVNVANLMLTRAIAREPEFRVRASLGAGRLRMIRQLLTESVLLSLLGGAAGVLLGNWAIHGLVRLAPPSIPNLADTRLDSVVLWFALGASLVTGIAFGLAPSIRAGLAKVNLGAAESGRLVTSGRAGGHLRSALLIAELAVAVVVVIAAGLLFRSLARTLGVDSGFDARGLLALDLTLSGPQVNPQYDTRFFTQALEQIRRVPGVESADAVMCPPMGGIGAGSCWTSPYAPEDRPAPPENQRPWTLINMVTPGYFRTMKTPLLQGRSFTNLDGPQSAQVAIVNQALALRMWPSGQAVGQRIRTFFGSREVVGVIGGVRQFGPRSQQQPELFLPAAQAPVNFMTVVVRTHGDPASLAGAVTAAIRTVDKEQPVLHVMPITGYFNRILGRERFSMALYGVFAALSILLAAVGVYGVSSYSTGQMRRGIGIRIALGARPFEILRQVIGRNALLIAAGLCAGTVTALACTRWLASQLFGITAHDPLTFTLVVAALALVALAACWLPARRTTRIDPATALRYE
jgi:putative ABC transport system permease protein